MLRTSKVIIWSSILENIEEVFSKLASVKYVALQFHQRNQEIQINFSGFCAKFQKIVKSMQSINKHADLWTNIYIFHLTTSPNSQITPYRKNRRIPRRSLRTGEIGGHPRSNEVRRRFIKSQPVHSPNDVLTIEVLPLHDMLISEWF